MLTVTASFGLEKLNRTPVSSLIDKELGRDVAIEFGEQPMATGGRGMKSQAEVDGRDQRRNRAASSRKLRSDAGQTCDE
ncbi:MAG: hypothetical protein Q8O67_20985 [Deltaproteobacteria bacterium]|nr:hypothetical protein [Deltaproteobacteria bacterium]